MESDDDYESFSFHNHEPSPSPKHRSLKRLKKSTIDEVQSTAVESVNEVIDLPKVDFARLEALEASEIRAFGDSSEQPAKSFDDEIGDDMLVNGYCKESKRLLEFEEDFDDDGKVKELRCCYDDTRVNDEEIKEKKNLEFENTFDDDVAEVSLSSGVGETNVRTDRKETKRVLDFDDDDVNESKVDRMAEKEMESVDVEVREDKEKESDIDGMNEKKGKKKKFKSSGDESNAKTSYSSKRREAKERRAHLDQLHVESQRLLRETKSVSFKPVPLVQKPISSVLERIKQRKLEVSKKFPQASTNDSCSEDDEDVAIDHSKSVEIEGRDLLEAVIKEKVSDAQKEDLEPDDANMDEPDACGKQEGNANACSQKDLDVESTPALRAPVDDTQELFGDSQRSDGKESENDESCEQESSSQEEEMGPSLLTMKLKFDSAPDDICDEEENDKENVNPHAQRNTSPRGDPVKAFVDDEAEEEDDSDNDRMVFGDEEEVEDEDEDDIEELNKMIATGYKERPIDLEARNELHQKWLEEKDAAGTDDLLRRLNVASKFKEASLLDEEEGDNDVEMNDSGDDNDNVDEDEEVDQPRVGRINSKKLKTKEMIAPMFNDKDDDYFSSDEEEAEKILVRERLLNKKKEKNRSEQKEKNRLVSPIEDEDSREVFGLIKKQNTVPEVRKKANTASFFDTMLIGGNSNSSSKSSFLSRTSNHSVPVSSKQGGSSVVRSFVFGRDDSNSRSSMSIAEDTSDTITSSEVQTKKVTAKYKGSQSQGMSSTQTTKLVSESSSSSFFEILKRSSVQSNVHAHDHKVELSQSVFAAFKVPKKPIKIQGRV